VTILDEERLALLAWLGADVRERVRLSIQCDELGARKIADLGGSRLLAMLGNQGSRLAKSKISGSRRARQWVRDRARALLTRRLHAQVHLAHAILQVRNLRLIEVHHPLVELQQAPQKHGSRRDHVGGRSAAALSAGAIVSLQKLFATIEHP
jgi:hypothetical protein